MHSGQVRLHTSTVCDSLATCIDDCIIICDYGSERRGSATLLLSDGSVWILGGYAYGSVSGTFKYSKDIWKSHDGGSTWILVTLSAGWSGKKQSN